MANKYKNYRNEGNMDLISFEQKLFDDISYIIEQGRGDIVKYARLGTVLIFWRVGKCINDDILKNQRADYGKMIVSLLATQLTNKYGRSFEIRNLRRMMQFAEQFPDFHFFHETIVRLECQKMLLIGE